MRILLTVEHIINGTYFKNLEDTKTIRNNYFIDTYIASNITELF